MHDDWFPAAEPASVGWPADLVTRAEAWAETTRTTALFVVVGGRTVLDVRRPERDAGAYRLDGRVVHGRRAARGLGLGFEVLDGGRMRHDIASAQKTVVALLTEMAVERGLVTLDDPVSHHLGRGWTACAPADEEQVTIRHALTMTSGLTDALTREAVPGTTWRYSLGPIWHQLKRVLVAVRGQPLQAVFDEWLGTPLGLSESVWVGRPGMSYPDGTPVEALCTTAVELARLGQVLLGAGTVDGVALLPPARVAEICTPSQELNRGYGLLTWINGQTPIRIPMVDQALDTWLMPKGPPDAVAMLGAMGQLCIVSPAAELILVRLGGSQGGLGGAVGATIANDVWDLVPAGGAGA